MELKRIIATDSRSANERAIALYGPDVLVISTQRIDNQTELIVAVDMPAAEPVAAQVAPAERQDVAPAAMAFRPFADVYAEMGERQAESPLLVTPLADAIETAAQAQQTAPEAARPVWATLAADATALTDAGAHEAARSREIVDLLRDEIAQLKKEFAMTRGLGLWSGAWSVAGVTPRLAQALTEVGAPAALQALLLDAARQADTESDALQAVQQLLRQSLTPARGRKPVVATPVVPAVRALVGPSGAGKTTMLGRLVLAACEQAGAASQAIISFNDRRPGAWSQVQLLAAQAGVTCYRAPDAQALQTLLLELQGLQSVWIDTPGLDFMQQAMDLRAVSPEAVLEVVLPVDATISHVRKVCAVPEGQWGRMWLSKLDEASMPWPLLSALCEAPQPLAGFGCSDDVRVPVRGYDPETLVSMALAPVIDMLHLPVPVPAEKTVKAPARRKAAASAAAPVRRATAATASRSRKVAHEQA